MKYKKGLIFICLIICLFSIASVNASDGNETVLASECHSVDINDSLQINENINEIDINELNDDGFNEINVTVGENSNQIIGKNELLTARFDNDVLRDEYDWVYVADATTKGIGTNIPIYVADSPTGFVLKDGQMNYQRYFSKHSDGNYHPDCYAEDYLLPSSFRIDDNLYMLTKGPGDTWYYKKWSYPPTKSSSIIVEDYDFLNNRYPYIGTGQQYSKITIPISVISSDGNYASGGVVVTDSSGTRVGYSHLGSGQTWVDIDLQFAGKNRYKVQFNSANEDQVASSSKYFYITSAPSHVSVYIDGFKSGDIITSSGGSSLSLDVVVLGASSGYVGVMIEGYNNGIYPIYPLSSINTFNIELPSEEGNYRIIVLYGLHSTCSELSQYYITGRNDLNLQIINPFKERINVSSSIKQISGKPGSTINFDITVYKLINPETEADDPIWYQYNPIERWEKYVINEGYISTTINNKEYQFPVNNSVAHISIPINDYLNGDYRFIYKESMAHKNGFSTRVNIKTLPFDNIDLIYDDKFIIGSDSKLDMNISVIGDQYCINYGHVILDIIDKEGNLFQSYSSKVSFGNATFNITLPKVIYDYKYRIKYVGFSAINNSQYYLNVYDYRDYSLKSFLQDVNGNNISLITGKYSGNSTFKIKVMDNLNEVNNNLVKLIVGSHEYISVINNNEANFNFKNEYYDKDSILMYYVVDGIDFFVKSIPYNVLEKDIVISLNETDIKNEFFAIKNVEINVIDEFGNLISGKIKSNLDGLNTNININNGKGVLTIKDKPIGNYTDTLTFEEKGCKVTKITYSFEITKSTTKVNIENTKLEVKIGDWGNDLIAFNITNKNNDEFIHIGNLNVNDNNFTIIHSSVAGKYFLKVPDKVGIYNLTITSNDEYYNVYKNFLIQITKIKPTLHISQTCIVTRNEALLDFYYLNNNINDLIDGNVTISINNKTTTFKYEGHEIILNLPYSCGTYKGIVKFEGTNKCLPTEHEFNITTVKSDSYFDFVGSTNVSVTSNNFEISGYLYLFTYENIDEFKDINIIINNKTYTVNGYYKGRMKNSIEFIRFFCELDTTDFFTAEEMISKNNKTIDGKLVFQGNDFINAAPDKDFNIVLYKNSQKISILDVKSEFGDNITIAGSLDNVLSEFSNSGKVKLLINDDFEFEFDVDDYQFNKTLPFNLNSGTYNCMAIFYYSNIFIDCNTTFKINIYKPEAIIFLNNTNISADFNVNIDVPVYVYDKFGNPLNGTILGSDYHEEFTIINGSGILKIIAPNYSIGDFEDSLIFISNETRRTEFKYVFHLLKRDGLIYLDKYEVDVGKSQKIPFSIYDKYNNSLDSIYTLNVENKEFNISSNYLIIPNKTGEYNLTINAATNNEYYKNFTTNILFKVNKLIPSLSISDKCVMGRNKHIYIKLYNSYFDVEGNVTVILNNCEYSFYYKYPYFLSVSLPDQICEYNAHLKYSGSEYFKPFEKNFTVKVDKGSTSINLTSSSEINSEIITISGHLNCDVSLFKNSDNIKLFLENNQYPVEIDKFYDYISFKSTINISGILSSKIKGKVVFEETDYLKSTSYEFNLYLNKQPQKLNIPNIVVELGKDIDIVGAFENIREGFKNDGEIYIDVTNGYDIFRIETNGNYTIIKTVPSFQHVGNYICLAKFYNSKLFYDSETWFNITVTEPKDYSVNIITNVIVKDDNYLNGADINIKLSQNIDVKANVILNNQKITTATIRNGVVNIHVNNLIVGENIIKIELNDEDYYGSCVKTFYTQKILSNDEININIPETNLNNDEPIVITLPGDAKGEVILTINNHEYKFKVENGISNVKLPDLKNGNYRYTITYSGDSKYSSFTKSNNLIVNKILKTNIVANNITVVYKSNKYVEISLKDSEGKPVTNENICININGETTILILDSLGTTSYSTSLLKPKTYVATVTFEGNKQYEKSTITVKVIVKKATPKITAKTKTFKKSLKTKKYSITLKNNLNKVMKNTMVTIKVNKKTYAAKTNGKGVATFKITKLNKKGTFKAVITYKGNTYYNKVTKKVNIKCK